MIPKVFHSIWLGSPTMPHRWQQCWQTWATVHPEWSVRVWTDACLPPLLPRGFETVADPRQRADMLRYALLFLYGGVYVDVDFECLRPLDALLDGIAAFAASEDGQSVSIGILGAEPGHPVFWAALECMPQRRCSGTTIGEQTGPAFFTDLVRQRGPVDFTVFPAHLFYPYSGQLARQGIAFDPASAPDAYAVHHWASIAAQSLIW